MNLMPVMLLVSQKFTTCVSIIQHNYLQEGQVTHKCSVPKDDACSPVEGAWITVTISRQGCPTNRLQLHTETGTMLLSNEKSGH